MSNYRLQNRSGLVMYHEATPGVPGANGHVVPYTTRAFGRKEGDGTTKRKATDNNPVRQPRGFWDATGNVGTVADEVFTGLMLHKLFGAATITPSLPDNLHEFKVGQTNDGGTLTIEEYDAIAAKGDQTKNVRVVGLDVTLKKAAEDLELTWDLMGTGEGLIDQVLLDAAPALYNNPVFPLMLSEAKIDNVVSGLITEMKLSIKRATSVPNVTNGKDYNAFVLLGGFNVTFSLTGTWTSGVDDLRTLASGRAIHAVDLNFPAISGTHKLGFRMPELDCYIKNVPGLGDTEVERNITIDGKPFFISSTEGTSLLASLICGTADFGTLWTTP